MTADREFDSEYLFKLARDKSAESRTALARTISDLFDEAPGTLSDRERSLMYGILHNVVHEVEMSVRQAVATRLSEEGDVPRELLTELANDTIEVAYPILSKSGLLKDEDLIDVIRLRTLEHQMAIAARHDVSEAVSDALVGTGEESVVVTLLHNKTAKISERTMDYLVEQSKRVDTFQEPLLHREDLRPELAKKMFLWVSAALRQHILDKYELDSQTVDDLLESVSAQEIQATTATKSGRKKTQELAEVLRTQGLISPDMLVTALREGEVPLFLAMFCKMTDLREYLANRILFEPGGEGLAIACRAVGIGKAVYASVFTLSQKAKAETAANIQKSLPKALAFYDKISPKVAADVLSRWKRGSDYLSAIRQLQTRIQSNA